MKNLLEFLANCKSAVRISDPVEIKKHLAIKAAERASGSPYCFNNSTEVESEFSLQKISGSMDFSKSFTTSELQAIAQKRNIPWEDAYADRFLASYGSDERVDSHGDIVLQNWIFDQFETNPAMPFNHDWSGMALGAHVDWKVVQRNDNNYNGQALWLLSLHATAEQYPFADFVYRMRKANFLRANSVGFYPQVIIDIRDEDERAAIGLGRWGDILDENILVENSPTLLGANHGALTILNSAAKKDLFRVSDVAGLREINRLSMQSDPDAWVEEDGKYRQLARTIFGTHPEEKFAKHTDINEPFSAEKFLSGTEEFKKIFNLGKPSEKEKEKEIVDPEAEPENIIDDVTDEKTLEQLNQELDAAKQALNEKDIQSIQILHRLIQLGAAFQSITITLLNRFDSLDETLGDLKIQVPELDLEIESSDEDTQSFSALSAFAKAAESDSTNVDSDN